MSEPVQYQPFPRKALFAAAALIGFTLLAVTAARLTGLSPSQVVPSPVVQSHNLQFEDRADGAVVVRNADTGGHVIDLAPASNGFVRGVLRSLVRERRASDTDKTQPFRLSLHADGRYTLEDLGTGRVIELNAFGSDNIKAFAVLLDSANQAAAH